MTLNKNPKSLLIPLLSVGGAVIPLIIGFIIDNLKNSTQTESVSHYQSAYWILIPCYAFILYYAPYGHKIRKFK